MSFTSESRERYDSTDLSDLAGVAFLGGAALFTVQFSLVLGLQKEGLGTAAVALLIIVGTLPMVLLSKVAGRIADRFDSRRVLTLSGLLQASSITAMAFAESLPVLLALLFLTACGTAIMAPTQGALVPRMAEGSRLPKAIAMVQTGNLLGMAAGPAFAGFIIDAYSTQTALAIVAVAAFVRVGLIQMIRTRRFGGDAAPTATAEAPEPATSWKMRDDRLFFTAVLGFSTVIAVLCAANVLELFLVREVYGASESMYGLINGSWTGGMVLGALVAAAVIVRVSKDLDLSRMLLLCAGATALLFTAIAVELPSAWFLIPLYLVGGVLNAAQNASVQNLLARRVPDRFRGRAGARVQGTINAATLGGFGLGALITSVFTVQQSLIVLGLTGMAVVAVLLPVLKGTAAKRVDTARNRPEPVRAA
ncbi:MFS transporter [Salininema proteolyticum]|uniref:MFS transporter n=1 Tax=Salininema proteolyticum TaxID=1607685 RepID=A0ABV8TWB4_9ACTN